MSFSSKGNHSENQVRGGVAYIQTRKPIDRFPAPAKKMHANDP